MIAAHFGAWWVHIVQVVFDMDDRGVNTQAAWPEQCLMGLSLKSAKQQASIGWRLTEVVGVAWCLLGRAFAIWVSALGRGRILS